MRNDAITTPAPTPSPGQVTVRKIPKSGVLQFRGVPASWLVFVDKSKALCKNRDILRIAPRHLGAHPLDTDEELVSRLGEYVRGLHATEAARRRREELHRASRRTGARYWRDKEPTPPTPHACPPCTQDCQQGDTCPNRHRSATGNQGEKHES